MLNAGIFSYIPEEILIKQLKNELRILTKERLKPLFFLFVVLMDIKHLETENNSRQTLNGRDSYVRNHIYTGTGR
nr:MAG TPA: hypothetical protein [Bacteriophage sp.]